MVATTLDVGRPSIDVAAGDLVLRICNSCRQGQTVRLKSPKCTIGSGPRCTLRLRARGVWPLHCLILRGRATTVVRRWAADTRLNDQAFADAVLSPGDRLSIGSLELEVVSLGTASIQTTADHPVESAPDIDFQATLERQAIEQEQHRLEELAAKLQQDEASLAAEAEHYCARRHDVEAQRQAINQEQQQWQAERDQAQRQMEEQRNEIAARLTEFQARENGLAEERRHWEAERNQNTSQRTTEERQFSARQAEVDAVRQGLEQQQQQWQAERDEAQRQMQEQRNELAARLAEFQARENGLAEERRQWEAERNQNTSQLTAEEQQLSARQAELDAVRQCLEQQQRQWQAERDEAERHVEEQRNELAGRLAELEAERSALEADRRQWEAERDRLAGAAELPQPPCEPVAEADVLNNAARQEPDFKTPSDDAPVDLAEVLRRVGAQVEMEEDASLARSTSTPRREPPPSDSQPAPTSAAEHGDQDSIDAYMSRLMQRVRSKSDEPGLGTYAPSHSEPPVAQRAQSNAVADLSSTGHPPGLRPAAAPRQPVQLSPRSAAPEKHIDFSALRDLANLSARTAISRHSHRIIIDTMRSKLAMALLALAAGGGLFWMWQRYGAVEVTLYYSLAAVIVAVYFGVQYALLTGKLRINERGHLNIDWGAFAIAKPVAPGEDDAAPDSPASPAADAAAIDGAAPAAAEASDGFCNADRPGGEAHEQGA